MNARLNKLGVVIGLIAFALCTLTSSLSAQSKPNIFHRHPNASAFAAGAGTTYMLRHSAHYKMAHGGHLTLAERHPYLSGMGVAIVTHHVLVRHHK